MPQEIKELLARQAKGEQLTEEELLKIKQFQDLTDSIAKDYLNQINELNEKLRVQTENIEGEKTQLQKQLEEMSKSNAELSKSKESLEKMIQESPNIEDIKIKLRADFEKRQQEEALAERKRFEEIFKANEESRNRELEELKRQIAEQKEENERLQFIRMVDSEIEKRPYLSGQLVKLREGVGTTPLQQSKYLFNFLIDSVNHDNAMENYKKEQSRGSSIFKLKDDEVDKIVEKEDMFAEFLKANPQLK